MEDRPHTLRELLRNEIPPLYAFAYRVSNQRQEAERFILEMCQEASLRYESALLSEPDPARTLLAIVARSMEQNLGRKTDHTFDSLDELLRSDITRPIDLRTAGSLESDPRRVHGLMWELKRTCLGAVLGCLPPGVRLSFVLTDLMGFAPPDAATVLGIKESAYRVRLTRARKRIEDYLTPRCYHVDRQNPCTCPGRLMIALDAGFIREPTHPGENPAESHDAGGPRRDIGSLYRGLPEVALSEVELDRLLPLV
ncbi:MAG: sigma-70 family RNA polymerase sigma factor [Nannocystaceae bacterium]